MAEKANDAIVENIAPLLDSEEEYYSDGEERSFNDEDSDYLLDEAEAVENELELRQKEKKMLSVMTKFEEAISSLDTDLTKVRSNKVKKENIHNNETVQPQTPPLVVVKAAHEALLSRLDLFENDPLTREKVLLHAHLHSDMSMERLNRYFGEVFNRLDAEHVEGLQEYLMRCCSLDEPVSFLW